jgi:hypothetical protein
MKIEDRNGESLSEATVTVDEDEAIDLLQGLADVVEGSRDHLHFAQVGGPQLVVRKTTEGDPDPLGRQMDWWVGPLILVGVIFIVIGAVNFVQWIVNLVS